MKRSILLVFLLGSSFLSRSQPAEDDVKAAVILLFTGMKAGDAQLILSAFTADAVLATVVTDSLGNVAVKHEMISEFAEAVAKLPKGKADERIRFDMIRVDGSLAVVWAPYQFYFNGIFSHCGVDSFQLVKQGGVWKIQYLLDTRRKKGCD